jgi:hypothetical protein
MVWCDEDFAQWGEYVQPTLLAVDGKTLVTQTHQVERIQILPGMKLVLINFLDDEQDAASLASEFSRFADLPCRST